MLTTMGKQYVPALLRVAAKSPSVYPAVSHAVEVVTSSAKFSSLSSAKKGNAPYRVIYAPRPKSELQDWNIHGTTTLTAPSPPTLPGKQTMMQLQGWNHRDPFSQLLGSNRDRSVQMIPTADIIETAKEMERIEEDALDEIAKSTGRANPTSTKKVMPHARASTTAANFKFPYYPQYASDLVNKAYEMENIKVSKVTPVLKKTSRPLVAAPSNYPPGASDLCDVAYQMDHPEETTQSKKKVTDQLYPQYHPEMYGASDLVNKAYELDHPELMEKK